MIAKSLFLAETFYRYGVLILRDHGIRPYEYPMGYLNASETLAGAGPRRISWETLLVRAAR